MRWTPGLSICREDATGLDGSEDEPLAETGRGSWLGFLGDGCHPWRGFLAVVATHFLGKVGVDAGEAAWDRDVGPGAPADGLHRGAEDEDDTDEDDARSLTAERGSMSGGGGGPALPW